MLIKCFSMFTGILGFELGAKQYGKESNIEFDLIGYSEIDSAAEIIIKRHYPNITNYGDATKIKYKELPNFDILFAGFPCPEFSIANKKRKGLQSKRGSLFYEIVRCIRTKKPEHFILENVRGILSDKQGQTYEIIQNELWKCGYEIQHVLLDAQNFGLAQQRKRIFIVGSLRGKSKPDLSNIGKGNNRNDTKMPEEQIKSLCILAGPTRQNPTNETFICNTIKTFESYIRHNDRSKSQNFIARTINTEERGIGNAWNGNYVARINDKRKGTASRFSNRLDKTARSRLIGNAVPPVMVYEVLKAIYNNKL